MHKQFEFWSEAPVLHSLFFGARPDAPTRAHLTSIRTQVADKLGLDGKPVAPERLHVSLLGLGCFDGRPPPAILRAANAAAGAVSVTPFRVVFDRVASFGGKPGERALVLTGSEGAEGFLRLRQTLMQAMFKAGMKVKGPEAFAPHLTLMYTDQVPEMAIEPVSWTVDGFALIDSLFGRSRHRILGHWRATIH